jgi:parvulin-like peptidyl-prolyl isomerase
MKIFPKLALLLPLVAPLPALADATPATVPPAAPGTAAALPAGVVAQAGSATLTVDQLQSLLALMDQAQRDQLLANPTALATFVRDRVLNQAILAEADAKGWDKTPGVQARAQQAYDNVVVQTYLASLVPPNPAFPTDDEVSKFYDANRDKLVMPRQFHLAQIVIAVPQGATQAQDDAARKRAAELRLQALKPKTDFGDLARKNSQEKSSADHGGDVGLLSEDRLLPVVRDSVLGLPDGGLTEPLRAADGWHVVKLLGSKPASPATLEQAKSQLVQAMRQARAQTIVRTHLQQLLQGQQVQVNEAALTKLVPPTPH